MIEIEVIMGTFRIAEVGTTLEMIEVEVNMNKVRTRTFQKGVSEKGKGSR